MNKYELAVILKPTLDEETQKAEFEKLQDLIIKFGGTIDKIDEWGRRKLAYEIQKHVEGVYSFLTFTAEAGVPAEIESRIRIMENVLRHLIVRQEM